MGNSRFTDTNTVDNLNDVFELASDDKIVARVISKESGLILEGVTWDYLKITYPTSSTETYTFRDGGSGGTISAVIEITYTNSSKNVLDVVERTT